ncbi:MAG: inositol monophosphatase [Desulfobacterota bacterium]|nr:inositol monophosphatase [Thermodesulfobacteriota bacterium]MDW8002221.1 inositol monophosphatase family protein [Deltaproteobacteria bacterium]
MDEILKFVIHCVKESGKIQRKYFQKTLQIEHKGSINLVTNVDLECQEKIVSMIRSEFPEDDILSEEGTNTISSAKRKWIIDPLDGTTNYAHGYPFFCTSIACEMDGELYAGAIYNPIHEELFYAKKGYGSYLNGERIRVSSISDISIALLSTGFPYDLATSKRNNIDNFLRFIFKAQAIRRDGSAALNLAYVAAGIFDGFWEIKLNPWDVAAGTLLVMEAGGRVTDFSGNPIDIYKDEILASNGIIHKQMLEILNSRESR